MTSNPATGAAKARKCAQEQNSIRDGSALNSLPYAERSAHPRQIRIRVSEFLHRSTRFLPGSGRFFFATAMLSPPLTVHSVPLRFDKKSDLLRDCERNLYER